MLKAWNKTATRMQKRLMMIVLFDRLEEGIIVRCNGNGDVCEVTLTGKYVFAY